MFGTLYARFREAPLDFPEMPFLVGAAIVAASLVYGAWALPGAIKEAAQKQKHHRRGV